MTDHKPNAPTSPDTKTSATTGATLRIRAVAERTGVPEPTLRAWELRYGVPAPKRTAAGYRLYSEKDIAQVERMQKLCASGMAAAEAARTVKSAATERVGVKRESQDPMKVAQDALLDAVVRFDAAALEAQLQRLLFFDSPLSVLDGVIIPVLREVGDRWHAGTLSVAQEHLLSHRIGTLLRDYVRWIPTPADAPKVLLASFADDEHDLGLLGAAVRLTSWGHACVFLGARTPPGALRGAVSALAPAFVGLSATISPDRARARELLDDYAAAIAPVPWIVGGAGVRAMADLVASCGGHVMPADPDALHALVRTLVAPRGTKRGAAKRLRGKH